MATAHPTPAVTNSRNLHLSKERSGHSSADPATTALVRRVMSGDREAVETLLVEAQETAWRFSMTVCGHPEDAEDAMQEALVRTFKHVPTIRDEKAFRPWLYRTVRNACLMSRRRRVAEPRTLASLDELLPHADGPVKIDAPSPGPTPEDATSRARLGRSLGKAMRKLPPAFRAVVFLRDMEGLSTRETADTLGLSEDNVKARLHRARLFLRKELAEWRSAETSGPRRAASRGTKR
jgi:RNA polymerase sigma-70 factor (ECF subfamily)